MIILRNSFLPFRGFAAINLCGILLCRRDAVVTKALLRHEQIHTRQMLEMLVVGFYLWYVAEWLVRLMMRGNAYRSISFEREAYSCMHDPDYLRHRRPYAWVRFILPRSPRDCS